MSDLTSLQQVHEFRLVIEVDTEDLVRRGVVQDRVQKAIQDPRTQEALREALPGIVRVRVEPE